MIIIIICKNTHSLPHHLAQNPTPHNSILITNMYVLCILYVCNLCIFNILISIFIIFPILNKRKYNFMQIFLLYDMFILIYWK